MNFFVWWARITVLCAAGFLFLLTGGLFVEMIVNIIQKKWGTFWVGLGFFWIAIGLHCALWPIIFRWLIK